MMSRAQLAVSLAAMLVLVAPASGDPKADASKAFAAGAKADRAGRWAQAVEHYEKAWSISPHPNVAYNIALALERLGRLREAHDWLAKFVERSTDAQLIGAVETRMEQLRGRPAPVTVTSKPAGILVIIDGQKVGTTPHKTTLQQGRHTIVVKPNEQGRREHTVTVEFGEKVMIDERYDGSTAPAPAPARSPSSPSASTPAAAPPSTDASAPRTGSAVAATDPVEPPGLASAPTSLVDTELAATPVTPGKPLGFMLGAAVGVGLATDAQDMMFLAELGVRMASYDVALRIGAAGSDVAVDAVIRYGLSSGRVVPFIGGGFAYQPERYGYCGVAGLRFDMSRRDDLATAIVVESGVRVLTGTAVAMSGETAAVVVPVLAYFEVVK